MSGSNSGSNSGTNSGRRAPMVIALSFFSAVVTAALLIVVASRPPRTAADVQRAASQLEQWLSWSSLENTDPQAVTQLTYTFGGPCGQIAGLALIEHWDRASQPASGETHLWFTLVRDGAPWFRSPSRPPLASVLLVRHDLNSDLVHGPSRDQLSLTFEPGFDGPTPGGELTVNNLAGAAKRSLSRSVNRRFSNSLRATRCWMSDRDVEVLTLFTKLLRGRACSSAAGPSRCRDTALTLFPSQRPGNYRVELRLLGEDRGMVPFSLEVPASGGAPRSTRLRLESRAATLDLPAALYLIAPQEAGEGWPAPEDVFAELLYRPDATGSAKIEATIDLQKLLAGTTWLH
jgi:hypothetical protein